MADAEKPPDSLLTCGPIKHYEGFLEKKGPRDKEYDKQWIMLLGDRMVAYPQRIAQRELNSTKPLDSVVINRSTEVKIDVKEKTKLTIKFKEGVFKFKMSTQDERDNWWIRFHALAKMDIPKINLLPGQIIALQEIIESAKLNTDTGDSTYTIPQLLKSPGPVKPKSPTTKTFVKQKLAEKATEKTDLHAKHRFYPEQLLLLQEYRENFPIPPTWFFEVTRMQSEELLLNNQESGAILIRECESHNGDYSLSMRQDPPPGNVLARPVIKHFRFRWDSNVGTFRMLIEEKQPVMATMYDLLSFFIDKHGGDIKPMQTSDPAILRRSQHPYERGLRASPKDPENGEPRHGRETYLRPKRVAPAAPELPSRPRPDRQSLPASCNAALTHQVEQAGHNARFNLPPAEISTSRTSRFSTSDVPSFPSPLSEQRAPKPPPPRQRCVSASITEENSPNIRNNTVPGELSDIFKKFGIDSP